MPTKTATNETAPQSQSPTESQAGQSAYDALPAEHKTPATATSPRRRKVWCVARIESYSLMALAACDPEYPQDDLDWSNFGAHTYITNDREEAFQHARATGGLLLNAETLPRGTNSEVFQKRVAALTEVPGNGATRPY